MASGCCGVRKSKLNSGTALGANNDSDDGSSNGVVAGPRRGKVVSKDMVIFCFDVLYCYLHCVEPPKPPKFPSDQFPLFVTWKLGKERRLRGCIGTFNSTDLHQGLREYAITSACKDSRFNPISPEEFSRLHCSVSLLMDFEVAEHFLDWEIGVHGIRIEFGGDRLSGKKAATYLPEVAVEQGWSHIQTIDSLLRKGGFKGSITPEVRSGVCLVRFQSDKMSISYPEYVAHRQMNGLTHQHGLLSGNNGKDQPRSQGHSQHGQGSSGGTPFGVV